MDSWCTTFTVVPFNGKYMTFYLMFASLQNMLKQPTEKFDFERLDQGHRVQHLKWFHSMININLYRSHTWEFFVSSHHFEIFTFQNVWPWTCRSRPWCTTFTVMPFNAKCITSYLMVIVMFARYLTIYEMFAKQLAKSLTLKMNIKVKKEKNGTCGIRLEMFNSIKVIFSEF